MSPARRWITNVPVSMPQPPKGEPLVSMGGFCFTENGIEFETTPSDLEDSLLKEPDHDDS